MSTQNQEKKENLERKIITDATVNELFAQLSIEFGYDYTDWIDEIVALQSKWQEDGFVEVYESTRFREYGRIKDSSKSEGASPWYIGIYHARLLDDGDHDPLVVVKFHETEDGQIVDMKLMLDHDEIFGTNKEKHDNERMREIRRQIDEFIQQADARLVDK